MIIGPDAMFPGMAPPVIAPAGPGRAAARRSQGRNAANCAELIPGNPLPVCGASGAAEGAAGDDTGGARPGERWARDKRLRNMANRSPSAAASFSSAAAAAASVPASAGADGAGSDATGGRPDVVCGADAMVP